MLRDERGERAVAVGAAGLPTRTPNPNTNQARSASGALLYLIEYTVGVDAPGAPEPVHVLCALAAGGAQLRGNEAQQLFTLTYRAPVSRWTTSGRVCDTIASFEASV